MNVVSTQADALIRKDGKISNFTHRIIFSNSAEFKGYEYYLKINERNQKRGEPFLYKFIPCGKCIGCRTQERKNWALRIELEAEKYEHNYFLTLTYDNDHLIIPDTMTNEKTGEIYENDGTWTGTLSKKDLSQFIKSFRTYCKREFNHDGIKFYGCGEYGDKEKHTFRPHYHIILMNCPELKLEPLNAMNRITKDSYYTNKRIEHIWGKGFITIGKVSWDSISYTAGYTMKKLFGEVRDEYYASKGKIPIFAIMSRNPGIGKEFFNKEGIDMYEVDEIINSKGQSMKPPRYFDKQLDKIDHEYARLVKFKREFISKHENEKRMKQTGKTMQEQMRIDEATAIEKQKRYNRERIK